MAEYKKKCAYCGSLLDPDDRNCPQCGAPAPLKEEAPLRMNLTVTPVKKEEAKQAQTEEEEPEVVYDDAVEHIKTFVKKFFGKVTGAIKAIIHALQHTDLLPDPMLFINPKEDADDGYGKSIAGATFFNTAIPLIIYFCSGRKAWMYQAIAYYAVHVVLRRFGRVFRLSKDYQSSAYWITSITFLFVVFIPSIWYWTDPVGW